MDLHLEPEEARTLASVLDRYLSDLRMEIVDTDNPEFKRELKSEQRVLQSVLHRVSAASV